MRTKYSSFLAFTFENLASVVIVNANWRLNQYCYSQVRPVPRAAAVRYQCEKPRLGHLVSINKTYFRQSSPCRMLMLQEVHVFGFKTGRVNNISSILSDTQYDISQSNCALVLNLPWEGRNMIIQMKSYIYMCVCVLTDHEVVKRRTYKSWGKQSNEAKVWQLP